MENCWQRRRLTRSSLNDVNLDEIYQAMEALPERRAGVAEEGKK